jgi:hypothetical protein
LPAVIRLLVLLIPSEKLVKEAHCAYLLSPLLTL